MHWSRFLQEEFVAPLLTSLASVDHGDLNDVSRSTDKITRLTVDCSLPLVTSRLNRRCHGKRAMYTKLPDDVKAARFCSKNAFDSWKRDEFSNSGGVHDNYRSKRRDYRKLLRKFLNKLETDKIKKLCVAVEPNEKLFWKLLKGQRFTTQMNAFLIDGKWITDKNYIRDMWVNHFEDLRKPSVSTCFDHEFSDRVATRVRNISASYQNELPGTLNEPLQYQEVFNVCFKLKSGAFGVLIDYEHIRFGGPILWKLLHDLYQVFFDKSSVCKTLKTGLVLPLFKGKGTKANNKDNYRGIILLPTLCKIYEMIILNRLEKFASHAGYFSEMQLGF